MRIYDVLFLFSLFLVSKLCFFVLFSVNVVNRVQVKISTANTRKKCKSCYLDTKKLYLFVNNVRQKKNKILTLP